MVNEKKMKNFTKRKERETNEKGMIFRLYLLFFFDFLTFCFRQLQHCETWGEYCSSQCFDWNVQKSHETYCQCLGESLYSSWWNSFYTKCSFYNRHIQQLIWSRIWACHRWIIKPLFFFFLPFFTVRIVLSKAKNKRNRVLAN